MRGVSRTLVTLALAFALPGAAHAWGGATHHYIARNWSQHLPPEIDGLRAYDAVVDAHVTDADTRRPYTPGEGPRHYIDIDAYPEFLAGTLPHDRAELERRYGTGVVAANGIVPWAVADVVTTLAAQFRAAQWDASALTIADLCHYVGDATQPLHCTANFDGQQTGDPGVHARYETDLMALHLDELHTPAAGVTYDASPVDTMFAIVTASWRDVAPLVAADLGALSETQGTIDDNYWASLWSGVGAFTRERIDAATRATASFVYTAWVRAGQPVVPGSSGTPSVESIDTGPRLDVGPVPFREALAIRWASGAVPVDVDVFDVRGTRVDHVIDRTPSGTSRWRPAAHVRSGVYFVRMRGAGVEVSRRVLLAR